MCLISKKDKIFIAGHRGMVGSALMRKFKEKGYFNLIFASSDKLDLTILDKVDEWFNEFRPDIVILAAAKVGGILANNSYPVNFLLENLKIQNNVIETAHKYGVKRFFFLGSSCIYPKLSNQPIKEESLLSGYLEETNQWYAIAKIAGLKLCEAYRKQYEFDALSLMPTNLYGPGDNYNKFNSHVIPGLIRRFFEAVDNDYEFVNCWGTGKAIREFLHVDDFADACIFLLENWIPSKKDNSFINIGTGRSISIKDLVDIIANLTGFNGKIKWDHSKPDGTPIKVLDIEKLRKLGWVPSIELSEGLKKTIQDFKKNFNEKNVRL